MASPAPPPAAGGQGKILGMKRSTGMIVLIGGAAMVGFILLSRLGSKNTGGSGGKKSPAYGAPIYGPGHENVQITVRNWQGHQPRGGWNA